MKVIEDSLKQCEEDCSVFPSPENMEKMENVRNEYELFYEHLSRGAIMRSRATWFEQGEKSNKYFLNLETYKKSKSCIYKVFTKDGFLTSDPKRIMKEWKFFSVIFTTLTILRSQTSFQTHSFFLRQSLSFQTKMLWRVKDD